MSKKTVVVQAEHTIFDDEGHALTPGATVKVSDGPIIEAYILNGFLTVVSNDTEKVVEREEPKKSTQTPTKTNPPQATGALTSQENANG
jgi:hypothetical protein